MPNANKILGLSCDSITPRYGAMTVAWDVTLSVKPGEIVALLGPNGAGKTSTVECLAGRVSGSGTAEVAGQKIDKLPPHKRARHRLALVPEDRGLFGDLSVVDNLRLGAGASDNPNAPLAPVLDLFPVLGDRLTQHASTLSGGEQQMLAVARAILADPVALIIDEATQGLAPKVYPTLIAALNHLRSQGIAILLVEQNVGFAASVCDRYLVMSGGRVVDEGTADELSDGERLFKTFVGS